MALTKRTKSKITARITTTKTIRNRQLLECNPSLGKSLAFTISYLSIIKRNLTRKIILSNHTTYSLPHVLIERKLLKITDIK